MMGNNVIRAEGKPKFAMYAMMIPSVGNLILDYLFIFVFDLGSLLRLSNHTGAGLTDSLGSGRGRRRRCRWG